MSTTKRVSRQGLTRCPSCQAHVKVSAREAGGSCEFCGADLSGNPTASRGGVSFVSRVAHAGRSGLIAASLLGAGCISGSPPSSDSPPADTGAMVDTAPDASAVALYGMPADAAGPEDVAVEEVERAPDVMDQALYGLPPDQE